MNYDPQRFIYVARRCKHYARTRTLWPAGRSDHGRGRVSARVLADLQAEETGTGGRKGGDLRTGEKEDPGRAPRGGRRGSPAWAAPRATAGAEEAKNRR